MNMVTSEPMTVIMNVETTMKNQLRGGRPRGRIDQPRGLLGDAGEQRVDGAEQQVGRCSRRNAGEGSGHARQRMPAQRQDRHAPASGTSTT